MNKGSITQYIKGKKTRRFPQLATLALASCVLVTMVALDASASQNGITELISRSGNTSVLATESSLNQLFSLGHHHPTAPIAGTGAQSGTGTGGTTTTTADPTTSTGASVPSGGGGGGGGGGGSVTTTTTPTTTTTAPPTTTTTADPSTPAVSGGLITAGDSRSECLEPDLAAGDEGLSYIEAAVNGFESLTNSTVTCVLAYLDGAQTWAEWDTPWVANSSYGYSSWVAQAPQTRQLVLETDLIPSNLADVNDPLSWEQSCAAGDFNSYATQLGQNLVAAGLQNSVIRLGSEANGTWENDFVGTTTTEQNLWASCFDNEVTALRQATGEHFLIDWNINACTENIPYANYYPGNAYVDIMGLDFYDVSCATPNTAVNFSVLLNETYGLADFEAFANAQGKPMSFPEWGLESTPAGDDPQYVDGVGSAVASQNFAFQAYFDTVDGNTITLGSNTPLSVAAYTKWFGNS